MAKLFCPTEENLALLSEPFGIHELSLEDCLDDNQIPKINEFETYVHILFNTFLYKDKDVIIKETNMFSGHNFLISVSRAGIDNPDYVSEYPDLMLTEMRNVKMGPSFAMHTILDYIVDDKFTAIELIGDDLANLEDVMVGNHNSFDHVLLQRIRQSLMVLRKSLFHEREILVKICRNDIGKIPDRAIMHYTDIYDHITKFFELTEIYREMVTSLVQTNLAMINNDIAKVSNDTNTSVRRLTLITTIFMPLTLIAGIGGMSEWSMMTGPSNWRLSYFILIIAMILIASSNYYLLKKLEKKDG